MKNHFLRTLFVVSVMLSFLSCEKYSDSDGVESKEANSTLTIRTRASDNNAGVGEGEETAISYPVNVYVFDTSGKCVAVSSIEQGGSEMSLKLAEGSYNVYAIAGASATDYDLPAKDNASEETVISLKSGKSHSDLMFAQSRVDLSFGEENKLTLSLARKVMLLENVSIKGVPSVVTAVSVTISPLYEGLLLNGKYSGSDGMQTVELEKSADGTTWTNDAGMYLLEASGPATIKVSLKTDKSTTSYSYSSSDELKANYKINIVGTYTGGDFTLNGTLTGAEWNGTKDIVFNFDESGSSTEEGGSEDGSGGDVETPDEPGSGDAPEVGTAYKGCYVLKSDKSGESTVVTLMSASAVHSLVFDANDETSIKAAVEAGINELANDEISGWRLATLTEMKYIKDNISEINTKLDDLNFTRFYNQSDRYYFSDNGITKIYYINSGVSDTDFISDKNTLVLRAFTTITFAK